MKLVRAVLSLMWLSACSFPAFDVREVPPPSCSDGKHNGDETGVDCGMAACGKACVVGQGCDGDADCSSGKCQAGVCKAIGCDDGERDGGETGKDCGMAACSKACPAGQGCDGDADCDGGKCQDSICRAASCDDQLQNADESDIDCGGLQGCARCAVNRHCATTADCDGGACTSGQCRVPTCKDQLTNGNETDQDCGGDSCLPCVVGQACVKTEDCDGVACTKGKCQSAACDDQVLNQDETDLDCGGSCATTCTDGKRCKVAGDCDSGVCPSATKRCAAPSCSDGVLNGDEPSTDCGASCSAKCMDLAACSTPTDCAGGACNNRECVPAVATGDPLPTVGWVATASDTFGLSKIHDVIDGDSFSDWTSGTNRYAGMWIQIDMGKRQPFFRLELDTLKAMDTAAALNIWVSDNGIFTNKVKKNVAGGTQVRIDFDAAIVARYVKIEIAQGGPDWWRVNEIRLKQ